MAIVTFGSTARTNNAIALKNTGTTALVFALLHGTTLNPGTANIKYLTFQDLDSRMRGTNIRNNTLYSVDSDGVKPYLDDVAEFAKLIVAGTVQVYSASQNVSTGVFTLNSVLATGGAYLGDGSVAFA